MKAKALSTLGALVAGLFLLPAMAQAQQGLTFDTTYRAANGQLINATVTINGSGGSYSSYNQFGQYVGGGTIYNARYVNFGQQPLLRGNWRWNNGGRGTFVWHMNNQLTSFSGSWAFNGGGGGGSWSGSLSGGMGQFGQNGPFLRK